MIRDGYTWDDDTNQANVEKHGISFDRASLILERGNPVQGEPYERNGEERIRSVGQVNGETIAVIHVQENDQTKIISAHKTRNLEAEYTAALAVKGEQVNQIFDPEFDAWRRLDVAQRERNKDAYLDRQQRDRQELAAAQGDPFKDIKQIEERQRVEAIAERAPRLARDQIERDELAQFFAALAPKAGLAPPGHDAAQAEPAPAAPVSAKDQAARAALAQEHAKQRDALQQRQASEAEHQALAKRQEAERQKLEMLQAKRESERQRARESETER